MSAKSCLLVRDDPGVTSRTLLSDKCTTSVEEWLNQSGITGQCTCSMVHMSSHNAVCQYCSRRENVGLSGYPFD